MTFEEALFALDDQPGILGASFDDGSAVWPSLRFMLRLKYMEGLSAGAGAPKAQHGAGSSLRSYLFHAWKNRPRNPGFRPDVLSIANYEGNPDCPNRMTVFLKEIKDLKTAEWLYSPRFQAFSGLQHTYSFDWFYFYALIRARLFRTRNSESFETDTEELRIKVKTAMAGFISSQDISSIFNQLRSVNPLTVAYRKRLNRSLGRIRPGMVLCSEGNNGDWRHAILFDVCKELKIPTAEVQHGIFNIGMKYGNRLASDPRFARYKSDYLFTFGPFHCSQTNVPSRCIPLGHHHLEKAIKNLKISEREHPDRLRILFVGEGIPPSSANNGLIRHTEAALKQLERPFELVVRLHPSEAPDTKYEGLLATGPSRYSDFKTDSIHQLIADSDVVISHASTVVYEALYFSKPVLVLEDENTGQYLPPDIGTRFHDTGPLLALLSGTPAPSGEQRNKYWADGTVAGNFMNFYKTQIQHT